MIAIDQTAHESMLAAIGPQLPVTAYGPGAFSVASATQNVTYIVRFQSTPTGALAECSCPDFAYRSTKTGKPCKHVWASWMWMANHIEAAQAA